jgi:hypothetical protein
MMVFCSAYFGLSDSMAEKIMPVVISTTIVITLFIIGRILDGYIKSKETRRNWYQKVIIDPNISKVDKFYKDILDQSKSSIYFLIDNVSLPHNDYLAAKTNEIEKFKIIKRAFEFEFILMVQTNYPEIADKLSEHLRGIEDCVTVCLDKNQLAHADFDELEENAISQKYRIYGILYIPMTYKRPRLRSWIIDLFNGP